MSKQADRIKELEAEVAALKEINNELAVPTGRTGIRAALVPRDGKLSLVVIHPRAKNFDEELKYAETFATTFAVLIGCTLGPFKVTPTTEEESARRQESGT